MITKGIRGAITVEYNAEEAIKSATLELLDEMIAQNNIDVASISHVIFTLTDDLNAAFPAKFARLDLGWKNVAMMCYHELDVPNSLKMCLRVLIVLNCDEQFEPKFVYLKGAQNLR
ncbi:MAG: chorismate mutase [Cyanobacteria bacterium SIG32]|nr:chorismate mutase [Cyanobacteria bacterium SIG32]